VKAEEKENSFVPIRLPWTVHPERTQAWRDQQDKDLGYRLAAQECDCDFTTSGDTVFEPELINSIEEEFTKDPLNRRGLDSNLWDWEPARYDRDYMLVADVARGDGSDYSAFHIFDIESVDQVAEYKGKLSPKDFGRLIVGAATEYNMALVVVENASIGWATIEQIQEMNYSNLYSSPKGGDQLDLESYFSKVERGEMIPGFSMTPKTRPLVIAKGIEYVTNKSVNIRSKRLIEELRVFVWKSGKAQSMAGYNDDLVMSFCTAMYVRDTALRMRQMNIDLTRAQLNTMATINDGRNTIYNKPSTNNNPYTMQNSKGGSEDISWLF
jgi:hypothetical protein